MNASRPMMHVQAASGRSPVFLLPVPESKVTSLFKGNTLFSAALSPLACSHDEVADLTGKDVDVPASVFNGRATSSSFIK